jgi:hypothetical protein
MRYILYFFVGFVATGLFYISQIFLLFPTPVSAEYWVREMLVIKRNIGREFEGQKKIVLAGGSSVLFGLDSNEVGRASGLPAINFGLMAGLPLDTVLRETAAVVSDGDILVLALEQDYYCREANRGYDEWQIRNAIAWDYQYWQGMTFFERLASLRFMSPLFPLEMIRARIDLWVGSPLVQPRLAALDDALVLAKYANPPATADNLYSIYNIDGLGNIRNSDEASYKGQPYSRADVEIQICDGTFLKIKKFVESMRSKRVSVFFMNPPFMALADLNQAKIDESDEAFIKKLSTLAPVLDRKSEILVPRDNFLNSDMHLNSKGRAFRTKLLIERLNKAVPLS